MGYYCSRPGFSVHGIFQARVLEWVAISSPADLPDPGIKPRSPALQADTLPSEPPGKSHLTTTVTFILQNFIVLFFNVQTNSTIL